MLLSNLISRSIVCSCFNASSRRRFVVATVSLHALDVIHRITSPCPLAIPTFVLAFPFDHGAAVINS